jgi:hypothetical protein
VTGFAHPVRDSGLEGLLKALIEEARQRARRRRAVYGGAGLSLGLAGAIVFMVLHSPANPQSGSPAVVAGPNAQLGPSTQAPRFIAVEHYAYAWFALEGKRGRFQVIIRFNDGGKERIWLIRPRGGFSSQPTGPYAQLSGDGRHVEVGGHASAWYARLVGYVRTKSGPRQHVVIKPKGHPEGTFVMTATEPGPLKRDSGTHHSWATG